MDSARDDNGGVAGTVLMRFVWPHGGRSVFLSGSFNRWSELVPMCPVEGCPRVFQAIRWITPGYHQYKFLVDGEWRYDEHQPCAPSEYGVVNTVYFTMEANCNPPGNPDMPMELDNEAFRRLVSVSDGTFTGIMPSLPESDLQVSRQRISVFLSTHTAYELLPKSGKVVALDVGTPVKQAFHILYEQGIPMAPLWDVTKGRFVGVLSALDFILILRELGNHGSNLTEEELDTHTISAWKEGKAYLSKQIDGNRRAFSKPLIHAGPFDNLKEVALRILENGVATVPIIYSSYDDGSFPQLLHLASLCGILKCICRFFKHRTGTLPILQLPICAIPVGMWVPKIGESGRCPLAMLRPSASLSSALSLLIQGILSDGCQEERCMSCEGKGKEINWSWRSMGEDCAKEIDHEIVVDCNEMCINCMNVSYVRVGHLNREDVDLLSAQVSCIPIVDDNDSLIDIYCRSDITALAKDKVYTHINLNEMTVYQALQLGQNSFSSHELKSQRCQMCLRSDTVHKVMERLAEPGVRRLIVVEAGSRRVEGIITLRDIFKFVLG